MRTESVSTHDLRPGDVLSHYGALFELTTVTWYSRRLQWALSCQLNPKLRDQPLLGYQVEDFESEDARGPVVVCETLLLNDGGDIPKSWLPDWKIQGNRAATWARVIKENA